MTKMIKSSFLLLVVCCMVFTSTPTVFASSNKPYGYTYDDAASGKTFYKYYSYNSSKSSYVCSSEFYGRNNTVCRKDGTVISNRSAGTGSKYNGFSSNGTFYFITNKSELISVNSANEILTVLVSGAVSLYYDGDDLAEIVKTTSGNLYLSTLTEAPQKDEDDTTPPSTPTVANRVEIYSNSAGELVYDAYQNNKLKMSIVTSKNGQKILNVTAKVRLSDMVKGAKFMGIDTSYNAYLYETNGTLYRFKYGNWYSAEKISLNSAFKKFINDDNGFVNKVLTSSGSYSIKQLTTSDKWKATKTYAVSKGNYITMYKKGSSKSFTLMLKNGILTLNGTGIATGIGKSKFGFISAKKIAYIKNGSLYTASISKPNNPKMLYAGAKKFKTSNVGLISKVVLTGNKTKPLK